LARDITRRPLLPVDGALPVGPVEPDPDLLAELAAPPDRDAWWRDRVAACAGAMR
jgi:O-succinylbenzoate synthase